MPERYLIWGAGGHGRVVHDTVTAAGHVVVGFADRDRSRQAMVLAGRSLPIVSEADLDRGSLPLGATMAALGIGDNEARWRVFQRLEPARWPPLIHPSAVIGSDARTAEGVIVMPGVVINAGAVIGQAVILNTGSIVEHDCMVGHGAHISPGAIICGGAGIGELAWIGAGATVLPGVRVGARSIVGAGSVVIADVAPDARVAGCPARPIARSAPGG